MERLVAAGIDPRGMVRSFQMLARETPDVPRSMTALSTHPPTAERIARLEQEAARLGGQALPLALGDWDAVRSRCAVEPKDSARTKSIP